MKWYHPSNVLPSRPWIHTDAVDYLESILEPDFNVCEFGGGGSTVWIALRVKSVMTCEPVDEWRVAIEARKLDNVHLFESGDMRVPAGYFDLVFIDGEPIEERRKWISNAHNISNTWIVIDNANRPEYAKEREALKEYAELVHTVDGNEAGTLYLVTEFWRVK
jgi:predicted O-methyltransferase YrrM